MLRDYRWSTQYKGFTIIQRNNGWYQADAYANPQFRDTVLRDLKTKINKYLAS